MSAPLSSADRREIASCRRAAAQFQREMHEAEMLARLSGEHWGKEPPAFRWLIWTAAGVVVALWFAVVALIATGIVR